MTTRIKRIAWASLLTIVLVPALARAQDVVVYYHTDAIGSVRVVTDDTGAVIARYDYLPFGERWDPQPSPDVRQFAGKERDAETGLDYFGARYYASQTGRFTTVDPGHVNGDIFDPQSWNAYAYARNNPLKYTDPTGTEYEICVYGGSGYSGTCGSVSDQYFAILERNPGAGLRLWGGAIFAGGKAVGYYSQTSVDPRLNDFIRQTGALSSRWLREQTTQMAVGAAFAAGGGLIAGALSGGLAADGLSVTGRLAPLKYGKQAGKLARQMAQRGWTDDMIREAVASGQQIPTTNFANGNPAIRFIHPRTGQSVIVDMVTKEIIMVAGRGFRF